MKPLLSVVFIIFSLNVFSQETEPVEKIFEGYVFTEDSVPVENAYLINYRTSRLVTTNVKGYFRVLLQDGDSLMVNHISLSPKVIHTGRVEKGIYKIYVPYRTYILKTIHTGAYEKMQKNAEETFEQAKQDFKQIIIIKPEHRANPDQSPYDDDKPNPGITVPILKLNKPKKPQVPE